MHFSSPKFRNFSSECRTLRLIGKRGLETETSLESQNQRFSYAISDGESNDVRSPQFCGGNIEQVDRNYYSGVRKSADLIRIATGPKLGNALHYREKVLGWEPPDLAQRCRALRARNPKRVRKESERVSRGFQPGQLQSPQRVRHGVRKLCENAASDSVWTLSGLRGALFGHSGVSRGRRPRTPLCQVGGVRSFGGINYVL